MGKIIDLTLPEWAWIDGGDHEDDGNPLHGRNVIAHIRSASVLEVFERDNVVAKTTTMTYDFDYTNVAGVVENLTILLHYSAMLHRSDPSEEKILQDILEDGAKWYCKYCEWEDKNIINDDIFTLN